MSVSVEAQEALLRDALGVGDVRLHGRGGESRTFRLAASDQLVTVGLDWPARVRSEADLEDEASLLRHVAERVTVPVPEVVTVTLGARVLIVRELPGRRLIDLPRRSDAITAEAADVMARTLAELHKSPLDQLADVAPLDATPPSAWREEAAENFSAVKHLLDTGQRTDVAEFLARPAPAPTTQHRFTHNDLGIEHVLVDPVRATVTGVIDWSDAAITDPAADVGRLLRDLGPTTLARAMRTYAEHGGEPDSVGPRARFYAVCGLLEDLAFGVATSRPEYVDKSLASWSTVLPARAT
ncbi:MULTISPECIES: phosphotransferase family protein [Mumia]|uniref:Phosphotransferase family protein n=1 Tax=Mumia xiangluensis TaxID=1678900 RepID=A0ABW1QKS9_9ACTN|nr:MULTISPECIES: aminoglycoside phosphotransferase family protein [Mumia]